MGVVIRQSITSTVISYAGVVIGYINLLYLYPRFLAPEQIGTMRAMQDAAILMAQFAQFGLAQSIIRFFPRFASTPTESRKFFNLVVMLAGQAFGVFLILYLIFESSILGYFQQNAADFIQYSRLTLYLTATTVLVTLMEVYSRSLLKTIVPNLLKEIAVRVLLGLLSLGYFLEWISFQELMELSVAVYMICLFALGWYLYAQNELGTSVMKLKELPKPLLREFLLFSLLSFTGTAGLIIIGKVDSLMVAGLLGLAPVAVYTTSFYMATVIEIPKRAMTQIASPLIARGFEKEDWAEVKKIYHKTALHQFILGSLLLLGIAANLSSIFVLMPKGEIYEAGTWVVIIVGAGKLVDMLFGPSSEIIVFSKYYSFNIVLIVMLAAMIITANNLLIPSYGIEGAAIGTALTLVVFNLIKFIFIWWKIRIQPFSTAFVKVVLISAVAWGAQYILPRIDSTILDIIIRSGVITAVFGALVYWTNVSPEGNELARKSLAWLGLTKKS
ncbi:MAG: polysaccharide biosynthesis C-terminal domain-containing protein [Cyclobacteriaceae bacterium]|nr:polysaccharide biosynthesis C-terminal domain-containing protein [Cyclobacteriaceae bacterium]